MTVTLKDGLFTFGSQEIVEVPPKLTVAASGDIAATNDATQKAPLGILYRHKGNVYRYVQFDNGGDNVAAAAGGVAHWYNLDPINGLFIVSSDYSNSVGKNLVAGILLKAVTDQYYTWIQVGGVAMAYVADSTVAGDLCIYGSTDLYFARAAVGAAVLGLPFGVALEAKSNTTANKAYVLLLNMIW
jgi:hypothetical protein